MWALGLFFAGILLASWGANRLLLKWLLAKDILVSPIGRSGHTVPTPVGAGLAVMGIILAGMLGLHIVGLGLLPHNHLAFTVVWLGASTLTAICWHDDQHDNHGIRKRWRFLGQFLSTFGPIFLLDGRVDFIPFWQGISFAEQFVTALGWMWFVNLYNFMDGINGITFTQTFTVNIGILLLALVGGVALPLEFVVWPLLILGAIGGFAFLNLRKKAHVFIGDTGAIGLGYILGFMLIMLSAQGLFWAAALLVLYYATDTGLTLLLRLKRREKVWVSARCHFYHQAARPYAWKHLTVCAFVAGLNAILIGLALIESWQMLPVSILMTIGLALCGLLLYVFYKKGGSQIVVPHLN